MTTEERRVRAVYVISVAADLAGVHPQTLRIYERKGLLAPSRTGGGSRRYSDHDISVLRRIQELTSEGLNLEGVRRVVALEQEVEELQNALEATRQRLHEVLDEADRNVAVAVDKARREGRRDLVPLGGLPEVWRPAPRPKK